jgi:signal transduction histidine kinase
VSISTSPALAIACGDLRVSLDDLPLSLVVCAADGSVLTMSPAAVDLLGSAGPDGPDALVGMLTAAGVPEARERLIAALDSEQTVQLCRGGQQRHCLVRGRRIDGGGALHQFVTVPCDQRREARRAEFQSLIAHDIRSPLAVIQGYAGLLASAEAGPLTATQREFLAGIDGKIEELVRLLDDFLDYSRLEAGALALATERISVAEMLAAVRDEHASRAGARHLSLRLEIADEGLAVVADPLRLHQVLDNLVGNAIKYADEGTWIEVSAYAEGDGVAIVVTDGGPGLPAEELARLFDPYQRASGHGGTVGTGLGLVVVRRLVEAHGGRVHAMRVPEAGLRFVTVWPATVRPSVAPA